MRAFFLKMSDTAELSIYEKNIRTLEIHYPILLREYLKYESDLAGRPDELAEIEVLPGRRGFPTFNIRALVSSDCHGKPFEFPPLNYRKAIRSVFEDFEADIAGAVPKRIRIAPARSQRLLPRFRTLVSEYRQVTGHSLFDPQRDADKKFKPEDFNEEDRVVLLGFGFGYEVRRLIEIESEKNISIIVIEPYVSVFKKALETVDLTDIIEKRKVVISFCVEPTELQYALLANVSHMNLPRFNVRVLPHATLYPDIFHIVGLARRELMTFITFNMVTGILAGPIFQNNLIMNFIVALKNPGIIELQDKFKNLPIFIVAPGPSLDANADMLKRVKGKALIIACDTATRILLRHGIEPDAIATIDFQPANFFKLRGIDTSFAYLFPALEVTPHLPLNHNGRMFNYYHSQLSSKVFDPILGEKGLISTGGSVLTDAFNIALSLGGDPIILVGVDLGFPGMKWYSEGSFDNGKFTRNLNDKKVEIIEVEDIHGNPMPTYRSFYEFIKWFRKRIEMTDAKVIDATEGGAKIEGAEIMSLSDAIDKYVTDDSDPRKILSDAYESFSPPPINTALEKIDEFIKDYGEIMGEMRKSAKSCKRALEILERSKVIEGNKELIRLLMRVKDSKQYLKNEKIDSRLGFLTPMMEKLMAEIFYHTQDESLPKRDQYAKLVSLDMDFYEKVIKGAENMKLHMESIRDEILLEEDHEEYV